MDGKNQVIEGDAGGWGGSCTCPDGKVYWVGDNWDYGASLSCSNGQSGEVHHFVNDLWSGRSVICGDVSITPITGNLEFTYRERVKFSSL